MLSEIQQSQIKDLLLEVGQFQIEHQGKLNASEIVEKSQNQLVSYVDMQSEEMLVKGLLNITPTAGFITEEGTIVKQNEELYWIIDPLDGTTNYLFDHTKFSISIALYKKGMPCYGAVYIPRDVELFTANPSGAYLNGGPFTNTKNRKLADSLIATGFPYYKFDEMDSYLAVLRTLMQDTKGLRRMGSAAIDLVYTAYGRFDAFFELNLSPWDVAGGAYIVKQAGGIVSDFYGGENYVYGPTILAGSSNAYHALRDIIAQHKF
jgi:myo-inositol-1(or 4)-monophosphatase